ncbi:MAG: hypothetical protein QOH81_1099 [Sphingomonadales bacterium]|nr:hypothetical protein [Sphingomonadales bacterium]
MSHLPLSIERKAAFLAELSRHGISTRAARAASPHSPSPSGCLSTFKDERQRDAEFAAAWDDALDMARAEVEHEIYRRAQEGVDEPVYGGKYREQVVGTIRRYSDRLLELRARALLPAYRDAAALHVNKHVTHGLDVGLLGDAVTSVALQIARTIQRPEPAMIDARPLNEP